MNELQRKFLGLGIEQIRANIQRTIMSYRNPWDIYIEPLQNSADAVIDKFGFKNISSGKIELKIDIYERTIIIRDNGIGIKSDDIASILVMGESLKRRENRGKYGFMGYGFTFVAFQTEYLKIESVYDKNKCCRTYNDLYKFVFESTDLPCSEEELGEKEPIESNVDSYTQITFKFPNKFPDETLENNIRLAFSYAEKEEIINFILRTYSPVGLVDELFDPDFKNFHFELQINDTVYQVKNSFLSTREMVQQIYPEKSMYNMERYEKFVNDTEHLNDAAKSITRNCTLIDISLNNVDIGIRNSLNSRMYIAATSKNVLNQYNSEILKLENEDIENTYAQNGIWLCIDGLPTGICIDRFERPNFLPYTCIVDIDGKKIRNELDSGRKGITSYRVDQIKLVVKEKLRELKFIEYRRYIIGATNKIQDPTYDPKIALNKILNNKKEYITDLNMKYSISNEQEVICLFTELIAIEKLRGYSLKVISSREVYDGLYKYTLEYDEKYKLPNDELGISKKIYNEYGNFSKDIIIEFKYKLRSLFDDIRMRKKNISDIDIIVCWDVEYDNVNEFAEKEGIILKRVDPINNIYYGATHEVVCCGRINPLAVIELKMIIDKLYNVKIH